MVTVVIPCYRSNDYMPKVVSGIQHVFNGQEYQIILVCDGSPDNTFLTIKDLAEKDKNIIGINLSRNFGQTSARYAAIPYIKGDTVVFMDDDGEHSPSDIPMLISKLNEGFDIVYAEFANKTHSNFKQLGSNLNQFMMRKLLGMPKGVKSSSFFVAKRFVVDALKNYKSHAPYNSGYILQVTKKMCNVRVEHHSRIGGQSGYSLKSLISIWLNGFTSFSVVPLRFASLCGILTALAGFIYGIYTAIVRIVNPAVPAGYSSLIVVILFTSGILMVLLGLLGEYVGRIFMLLNNIPQYIISEVVTAEEVINDSEV